jgi:hypothetical protein
MIKPSYIKKNNLNTQKIIKELEVYFFKLIKYFKLNNFWKEDDFFQIEIKKSLIRALLRESVYSKNLLLSIIENYKNSQFFDEKIKWCTKLYPMIHLSNDRSEAIGYHYDQIGKNKFFTSWIPITNYNYPALAYVKYSQFFHSLLSKLIIKLRLTKIFSKKILVNKGDILLWNGNMIHQGNLNISKEITLAVQMKLTEKKFKHEKSIDLDRLESDLLYKNLDIDSLSTNFKDIIYYSQNLKTSIEENISKISIYLKNNLNNHQPVLSFALSVLAQRILTNDFLIDGTNDKKKLSNNLDIFSLYLGGENLSSIERLLKNDKENRIINILKKNDLGNIFENKEEITNYFNE